MVVSKSYKAWGNN